MFLHFRSNVHFGDNDQIILGDGPDLKIYHDGSNSYVEDTGVGALIMKGSTLRFRFTSNEKIINAHQNGSVDLFYGDSKKFETTASGIDVTGLTETDTLNVSGNATVSGDLSISNGAFSSATATTTTTSQTAIDTFAATTYRSVKYQIQITRGSEYHITEVFIVHDGTTSYGTEYATIKTGSSLASFDTDIDSGNVRLLATPTSSSSTVFKLVKTLIKV